jgi:Domain of unknown function (DUF5134)
MITPSWILDILAAVMLLVAAVSASRLAVARPWAGLTGDADIDIAHLLMGIAMAGTLAASLATLSNGVWSVIFAVLTAWFAWRVYHESRGGGARVLVDGHHAPHLVHSAAMLYMFVALTTPVAAHGAGMSGMSASGTAMETLSVPVVAFLFALLLAGYAVMDLDWLSSLAPHGRFAAVAATIAPAAAAPAAAAAAVSGSVNAPVASVGPAGAGGSVTTVPERAAGLGNPADDSGTHDSARKVLLDPRTAVSCRIAMGVTMAFMLIIMI